ncbi:hypothetical protein F3X20_21320 [Salmonella enterica subsp. enterica]|nr:hypothetical protein [Salmonella enterica subsp. enterica serovar Brandenburg]ECE7268212.1 hypothetical protein [Salmonella enterica subsp. enterica serovar Johannesburg]ECW3006386.1 hypothetical protein [Salmonella enterica subsp. enterica serovar Chester]
MTERGYSIAEGSERPGVSARSLYFWRQDMHACLWRDGAVRPPLKQEPTEASQTTGLNAVGIPVL